MNSGASKQTRKAGLFVNIGDADLIERKWDIVTNGIEEIIRENEVEERKIQQG